MNFASLERARERHQLERKSWDRFACEGREYTSSYSDEGFNTPVRVVPWPEGAPDPATVPQANERVTYLDGENIYTVINGIPEQNPDSYVWYLWICSPKGTSARVSVDDLRICVEPPASPKLYSAQEIEEAFSATAHSSAVSLIERMNS